MRKLYFFILLPLVWFSCSSPSNYEKIIIDYLETDKKGIKTDLQIEILSINVSDITVSDSTSILQKQFEAEKAKKIESAQNSISRLQEKTKEQRGKKNQAVAKALISRWEKDLEKYQSELSIAQNWQADYLNRYDSRNTSEILAKKADCKFSFFNPQLQTKQEMNALFILSADGKQCNNMIKQ
ncbi:hypothetical protein JGH11_14515 [Dysgonomonas sp. Marseille-P4677]|uniref:hypothetical protein n=1 Tax=Dysgonomonas sp. Marseille-P4677 TaxID=2364790 RepID=UPI001912009B|nr:hypothetical protein [Dysgonomonas sp. Marseille-P4677]MBK5722088.1 hypothetical protein [Dysgonomonas sp. Marseille-P4677]